MLPIPTPYPLPPTPNPWDHFWFRRVPPHALALTRIAIGLFLLVYAGLYVPNLAMLFSNEGLVLPLYLDRYPSLAWLLSPPSPLVIYIIYALYLLSMVGITLGLWFRLSVITTLLGSLYIWQLQLHGFATSYNRILLFCLLVLLCSGAHRTFSLDQKRRSGSFWNWEPISILPQRLISLQITATFVGVSLQKFWLPHWKGGEILAYSYISRWGTPLARWYARLPLTLAHYDSIVWIVKILEPLCAVGIWIPRIRIPSIIFTSAFLILVGVMLSIWWFIFIIPAFVLFLKPEDVLFWCRIRFPDRIPKNSVK